MVRMVKCAPRLGEESSHESHLGRLLVSRETLVRAPGEKYIRREIGQVRVKGKERPVAIVEIAGNANDGVNPELYNRFAYLIELLQKGQVEESRAELNRLVQENPDDGVISMYAERFAELDELPREMLFEFDTK